MTTLQLWCLLYKIFSFIFLDIGSNFFNSNLMTKLLLLAAARCRSLRPNTKDNKRFGVFPMILTRSSNPSSKYLSPHIWTTWSVINISQNIKWPWQRKYQIKMLGMKNHGKSSNFLSFLIIILKLTNGTITSALLKITRWEVPWASLDCGLILKGSTYSTF